MTHPDEETTASGPALRQAVIECMATMMNLARQFDEVREKLVILSERVNRLEDRR